MCDCFHLAFPNWHGPAMGAGRRLRGPEQDTEDDSVCEEPEILEGERPRPQGSSPTEEFPAEKQGDEDIDDAQHKTSSNKKNRKIGFGSLFDKHSAAKMSDSEDMQSGESGVIVKTVKEACAEGLVVTGGGKEGIFIKEVKPDSPASKHLSMKKGDQIISATVYFDNVSYEDALQILEHAQPYKMEFCLRRKVESTMTEDAEIICPEGTEGVLPEMRGQRKMKKQQDRISWPKFPNFGKGRRTQFKRSHSTSEAEECRKLEMSPPTSDTESPLKSPLKSPDGKDKKRKHKIQIKMKGQRSKSVEESEGNENEFISEDLVVLENREVEDILEEKFPEEPVTELGEIPQVKDEPKTEVSPKIENGHAFPHRVHLISLGSTLKTTDISVDLVEGSADDRTSEERKTERSEIQFNIQRGKSDIGADSQSITSSGVNIISDQPAYDNIILSPAVISNTEVERSQHDTDISGKKLEYGHVELSRSKLDASQSLSDVGVQKKSPGSEKQWKERTTFENESYGIRTRGPLADMATSKTHFAGTANGLQFVLPDLSEITRESSMPEPETKVQNFPSPVISQPKPDSDSGTPPVDKLEIQTKLSPEVNIDNLLADVDKRTKSKFKLPKVELSGFVIPEPIKMTKVEQKTHLPKREDIEIPGMEDKKSKTTLHTAKMKTPKTEKIINITKNRQTQPQQTDFNVEDVKVAVSKFPALKLPEGDITGVLVQREITIMEMKADKANVTPRGSPCKTMDTSSDIITQMHTERMMPKVPKLQIPYIDEQTPITVTKIDYTMPRPEQTETDDILITDDRRIEDVKFKLPKREDIEIPGMESIKKSNVQSMEMKTTKDTGLQLSPKVPQAMSTSLLDEQAVQAVVQSGIEISEKNKTKKSYDLKEKGKKSNKSKITMPSIGITTPDIRFPDVGIELPKKDHITKGDIGKIKGKIVGDVDIEQKLTKDSRITVNKTETSKISLPEPDDITIKHVTVEGSENKESSGATVFHEKETTKFKIPKIKEEFHIDDIDDPVHEIRIPQDKFKPDREKQESKFTSQTKFNLFSIMLPKSEVKDPKGVGDISMEVQVFEKGLSDTELKLPAQTTVSTIKVPDLDKGSQSVSVDVDASDFEVEGQGSKFKLPKFEISFPEVKLPKISSATKKEVDVSVLEKEAEPTVLYPPEDEIEKSTNKPDIKAADVDVSLPCVYAPEKNQTDIAVSVGDAGQKDQTKFGSPTKFKLPSISLPKFGAKSTKGTVDSSAVNIDTKEHEDLRDVELKLSAETPSVDVKLPNTDKDKESHNLEMKGQDVVSEGKGSKFKLPKFGVSFPETIWPKADTTASKAEVKILLAEEKMHPTDLDLPTATAELQEDLPERPDISFPKYSFPEAKSIVPKDVVSQPIADNSLLEGNADLEKVHTDISVPVDDKVQKDGTKFGSPTKFKLPSISLPKFGTKSEKGAAESSDVDVQTKGTYISLPNTQINLPAKPQSADIRDPDTEKEETSFNMDMKAQGKFKLPKFGISVPEIKGPKIDLSADKTELDITLPEGKAQVHPSTPEAPVVTAEVKDEGFNGHEVTIKRTDFSSPKFVYSESETKSTEGCMSHPDVDVSLPEGGAELEGPKADISVSDAEQKDQAKFGSPTKFKLPSITLPKFGAKSSKEKSDISSVEIDAKVHEISLPDTQSSSNLQSDDIKRTDVDKDEKYAGVNIKAQDMQIEEQESKLKMPKFGISLPELKGPKMHVSATKADPDIVIPEGKVDIHLPNAEVLDVDLPEVGSKGHEVKSKKPSFSFPKFGYSRSEIKVSEGVVRLPDVDMSVPEGGKAPEEPKADITVSVGDAGQKEQTKFGSTTKFKFPSINLPKFGAKSTKETGDIYTERPDTSILDTELKLPSKPLSIDMEVTDKDEDEKSLRVDIKAQDIQTEGPMSMFKLPQIGLPEVKGPDTEVCASKTDPDISIPEGKIEMPNATMTDITTEVVKSERKTSEVDAGLPDVDMSLKASVYMEKSNVDFTVSGADTVDRHEMFAGDSSAVDVQVKGANISLPDTELKLSSKLKPADLNAVKEKLDITIPKEKAKVHPSDLDVSVINSAVKELQDVASQSLEVNTRKTGFSFPKFGFSKSETKGTEADVSLPDVEVSSAQSSLEIECAKADITVSDVGQKEPIKFGSPTKFKLPSINLPKFGIKAEKEASDRSGVEVKGPKISLPDAELKLSSKPQAVDMKRPDDDKEDIPLSVDMKAPVLKTESGIYKFKFPKFGISLPEVKGPETELKADVKELDIAIPEGNVEVHLPDPEVSTTDAEGKELKDVDSKNLEIKTKGPGFSFPKFGFSKSETKGKGPEADMSLLDAKVSSADMNIEVENANTDITVSEDGQQEPKKFGSPTKFKLPSINLPKFGIKAEKEASDRSGVEVKGPKISLPDAELKLSSKPQAVDMKRPDDDKEDIPLSVDMKAPDLKTESGIYKLKFPKFGISLPEVKGPETELKADVKELDIAIPEGNVEVHLPDPEVSTTDAEGKELKDVDSKNLEIKTKGPGFSFPKFGFSKSETKGIGPEADMSLPDAKVSSADMNIEVENANTDITVSEDRQQEPKKFGSPTKFKLPSISLPKFGTKAEKKAAEGSVVDVQVKAPEIGLSDAELKLSSKLQAVDMKRPDGEKEDISLNVDMKAPHNQTESGMYKFKFPKFGISLPEVKGPETELKADVKELDIAIPEGNVEVHITHPEVSTIDAELKELQDVDSQNIEVKTKRPGFSFPKFGFSKSETKGPETDISLPDSKVSLADMNIEIKDANTDITESDVGQKEPVKFGSPTKFKIPSISLPKFGIKADKEASDRSGVEVKGHKISLPDAELNLSSKRQSSDMKRPDDDKYSISFHVDTKAQNIQNEPGVGKFRLPKFGISLPEVKGPSTDLKADVKELDIAIPEGNVEVHLSDPEVSTTDAEGKELKDVDSKNLEIKTKGPDFSFPKFGFSKSETKGPEAHMSLPDAEMSLAEKNIERKDANTDITESDDGQKESIKFGSPTKFKLPSISLPKFGTKAEKKAAEDSVVDIQIKAPEIDLSDAELKLSSKSQAVDMKRPDGEKEDISLNVDMKAPDIQTESGMYKLKLSKFGIRLPDVKGPEMELKADVKEFDIAIPEGNVEVHLPDPEVFGIDAEDKELQDADSQHLEIKPKRPGFSFPKFGFSKSETKGPEADMSLPDLDMSSNIEMEKVNTDIIPSDGTQKETKFGSPTKFKLPSITLPKLGAKSKKGTLDIHPLDTDVKGHEKSLPQLSADPVSFALKGAEGNKDKKSINVDIKDQDIHTAGHTSKIQFPKFGINIPELKGPDVDVSAVKTDSSVSQPEGKLEVHLPDADVPDATTEVKVDLPEVDPKIQSKSKQPSFSFPKFGFSKSEIKDPETDVSISNADMSLPEGNVEMEGPDVDITVSMNETNKVTKFGIRLPEIKGPKMDASAGKIEPDISLLKEEVNLPNAEIPDTSIQVKTDLPNVDSTGYEVKLTRPDIDVCNLNVDISLPEGGVDVEGPNADIKQSMGDTVERLETKFGSPTKFKLPSISLPKFGTKSPKQSLDISDVDVQIKGPETNLETSLNVEIKTVDIKTKGQAINVNLPEFQIIHPEGKDPKIDFSAEKRQPDITQSKEKAEVHSLDAEIPAEVKQDPPDVDSKKLEGKVKRADMSFPKPGYSKLGSKGPEANVSLTKVDVSYPEESIDVEVQKPDKAISEGEGEQKQTTKFGSPTKFKLPSINFPKFGARSTKGTVNISAVDTDSKKTDISLQDADVKLSAEPLSTNIKGPDADKDKKSLSKNMEIQAVHHEKLDTKFRWPKFGISLPEVKGPRMDVSTSKTDSEISLPKGTVEAHLTDGEVPVTASDVKVDLPEVDSKGREVKSKRPSFTFPKFGFSKSDVKAPEAETILPNVDVSLPEESVSLEKTQADITASVGDTVHKHESKFGSPTKLKLPSISLPKFGIKASKEAVDISAGNIHIKGSEITLTDEESKLSDKSLPADLKGSDINTIETSLSGDIKVQDIPIESEFGINLPEAKGLKMEQSSAAKTESGITLPEGNIEVHPLDFKGPAAAAEVKIKRPAFSFPKFGFSKMENKAPEESQQTVNKSIAQENTEISKPNVDVTLPVSNAGQKEPKRERDVSNADTTKIKLPSAEASEYTLIFDGGNVEKYVLPGISSKAETSKVEIKPHQVDVTFSLKSVPQETISITETEKDTQSQETEHKDSNVVKGSPIKFKLTGFKMPTFGKVSQKTSETAEISVPKADIANTSAGLSASGEDIKFQDSKAETAKKEREDKGSPSRFKLPTIKMAKISSSKTKSQDGDDESTMTAPEVISEPKDKEDTQRLEKSKFTMPTLDDVLRGFDVEFNVPTLDETNVAKKEDIEEKSKTKFKHQKPGLNETLDEDNKMVFSETTLENNEKQTHMQTVQKPKGEKIQAKSEESGWFSFPKFSSEAKTANEKDEKETFEPPKKPEDNLVIEIKEKDSEKSSTKDSEEDNISPTLSLRSSDAFADVSSAPTTELGLLLISPTKVKVKYYEPTPTVDVSNLHGDLITSTARTQLISMEPNQPEKVNIPFSSETSSSSLDTFKQMSGQIKITVSNVQTLLGTQHGAIVTKVDETPSDVIKSTVLSAEKMKVQRKEHILVEKQVVKEVFGDDKEKVLVTQRIQVFEPDSDTASSIQKLKDTVHTEKMRFFENVESNTTITSTETVLRHVDSSADENEGK